MNKKIAIYAMMMLFTILLSIPIYADLTTDIFGAWKFDDGAEFTASEGGWTWSNQGSSEINAKDDKGRLCASASSQYLTSSNTSSPTVPFTINIWVNLTSYAAGRIWDKLDNAVNRFQMLIIGGDGKLSLYGSTDGSPGNTWNIQSSRSVSLNAWTMVTTVYNGSGEQIYFNASLVAEGDDIQFLNGFNGVNWALCRDNLGGGGSYINGAVDEFTIWNQALTQSDISDLYEDGAGFFYPYSVAGLSFSNFQNNASNPKITDIINYSIDLTSGSTLDFYIFADNQSGTLTNGTPVSIGTSSASVNEDLTITLPKNNKICGQFWFNDSSGSEDQTGLSCFNVSDTPTSILFLNQTPSSIIPFNAVDNGSANFTYNITDKDSNNFITTFFYKHNDSIDEILYYVNGSIGVSGWTSDEVTQSNISSEFLYKLDGDNIYPATYNIFTEEFEDTAHIVHTLSNSNSYARIEFLNVSLKNTSIVEIMINSSGAVNPMQVYYCNSSYTSGVILNSPNCGLIFNIIADTPFVHQHNLSFHIRFPFNIDENGTTSGVGVTSNSSLIFRGATGGWDVHYIADIARTSAAMTTANGGNSWTPLSGTFDAHIYQFDLTDTFNYLVQVEENGNFTNSTVRSQLIGVPDIAPSSPDVFRPNSSDTFNTLVQINYTASQPSGNKSIGSYTIALTDDNSVFVETIKSNELNLSFKWDSTGKNGAFRIRVEACDSLSLCSFGFSENFTIDNTDPVITTSFPSENNNTLAPNIGVITLASVFTDNNDLFVYNVSVFVNSTSVLVFNTSALISGTTHSFNQDIDTLSFENTTYRQTIRLCDSHTKEDIPDMDVITSNNRLMYQYRGTWIKIKSIGGNEQEALSRKKKDRYSMEFYYDTDTVNKIYEVTSNRGLIYIEESSYKGHFIINQRFWLDFETSENSDVTVELIREDNESDMYRITVDNDDDYVIFDSIGFLNCVTEEYVFELVTTREATLYDINLLGGNLFNNSAFNPRTTPGVLLFFFLTFVLIGLTFVAEHFQIPAMMILVSVFGFFVGILFYVSVSAIMGVIVAVIYLMYMIRSIIFTKSS